MRKLLAPLLGLLVLTMAAPAGAGTVEHRASVPWDEVGDGWVLATVLRYRAGGSIPSGRSLELVSPAGTRYSLYATRRQPGDDGVGPASFDLIGWDPDARVALLQRSVSLYRSQAIRVDLESGASQTVALPKREASTGLRPDGTGVLSQTYGGKIFSISWAGTRSFLGRGAFGRAPITTPDGAAVVVADRGRFTLLPLDGSPSRDLTTPGECRPLRWYDDTQLLATCYSGRGSRLVTVGLDGTVTARAGVRRTTPRGGGGPSTADTDVRLIGDRAYYEGNVSCGGTFIARQDASGQARTVRFPGGRIGIDLVDTVGERLLGARVSACDADAPPARLSLFDPVAKQEEVLLTLGRRERWDVVTAWDEPLPWGVIGSASPLHSP